MRVAIERKLEVTKAKEVLTYPHKANNSKAVILYATVTRGRVNNSSSSELKQQRLLTMSRKIARRHRKALRSIKLEEVLPYHLKP